jgi:FeS assembly SUF system protein
MTDAAETPIDLAPAEPSEAAAAPAPLSQKELDMLTDRLVEQLKTVFDPEIPVDIYELGLIYKVDVSDDKHVAIDMTLTAPGCPVAGEMPGWVEDAVMELAEIKSCTVDLVFDPPWDPSRMSDEAKLQLNMF